MFYFCFFRVFSFRQLWIFDLFETIDFPRIFLEKSVHFIVVSITVSYLSYCNRFKLVQIIISYYFCLFHKHSNNIFISVCFKSQGFAVVDCFGRARVSESVRKYPKAMAPTQSRLSWKRAESIVNRSKNIGLDAKSGSPLQTLQTPPKH